MAKKFDVFFSRNGHVQIEADSQEEAQRLAEQIKYDDVSWDDDWNVTDMTEVEV